MQLRSPEEFRASILKIKKLYSTPQVLSKALQLVNQPDVNLDPLADLINFDPALAADLIRISNSALFSRGQRFRDVQSAIQWLGVKEVLRIISLSLSKNMFGKGLINYGLSAQEYWNASVLAALTMETLAKKHKIDHQEAHMVGILHAIGRVLINEALEEIGWSLFWDNSIPVDLWELENVGFTHAGAGALLLREWKFPQSIYSPIEQQLAAVTGAPADSIGGMMRFTSFLLYRRDFATLAAGAVATVPLEMLAWAGFESDEELSEFLSGIQKKLEHVVASLNT